MEGTTTQTAQMTHHRVHNRRLTPEDFVLLIIHSIPEKQQKLAEMLKGANFTVHMDSGYKGSIGSALMFTPNLVIFDWDHDAEIFQKTLKFIRTQKLAHHISQTQILVLVSTDEPTKDQLKAIEDPQLIVVEHQNGEDWGGFKRNILQLFFKVQKATAPPMSETEAASHQQRTSSINEILVQHKKFSESIIRTFQILVKKVAAGDPQKIFDTMGKTLEILNRPFILQYHNKASKVNFEEVFDAGEKVDNLREVIKATQELQESGSFVSKVHSIHDRRCFFGDDNHLYFATESPDVYDELDNFSMVCKNFEMFLVQSENRKKQLVLMDEFKVVFDDVYGQMEGFEWSESLENMRDIVTEMFSMDDQQEEEEEEAISGELELF